MSPRIAGRRRVAGPLRAARAAPQARDAAGLRLTALLWLKEGRRAAAPDFDAPGAARFASFEAAIRAVHREAEARVGAAPWALLGDAVLAPDALLAISAPPPPFRGS